LNCKNVATLSWHLYLSSRPLSPNRHYSPATLIEQVLGVIPARLNSSRLPRKALLPLAGKPLIYWVWTNAVRMDVFDKLLIGTDSEEIAEICGRFGACVELTGSEHSCGTERVAEVASKKDYKKYELVINIQGDLPLLGESCLEYMLMELRDKSFDIVTCGTKFKNESEWRDPSKVKMNLDSSGSVLGFSRKGAFGNHQEAPGWNNEAHYRHIGAYGCVREVLIDWAGAPRGAKEEEEGLEQLRAMKLGLTIGAVIVPSDAGAVDTFEDVSRIEEKLAKLKIPYEK